MENIGSILMTLGFLIMAACSFIGFIVWNNYQKKWYAEVL